MTAEHDELTVVRRMLHEEREKNAELERELARLRAEPIWAFTPLNMPPVIEAPEPGLTQETEHA